MATSMYMHSSIPRSSSTSDLCDASIIPAINHRKRKVGSGLRHGSSHLDLWSVPPPPSSPLEMRRHQFPSAPRQLTPYQLQRRQMKSSFQFPNGENFSPRYLARSSSSVQLAAAPLAVVEKQSPSRAQTLQGFRVDGDSRSDSSFPRSQSLTALSLKQGNLLKHNSFPSSTSTENELSRSSSQSTRNSARIALSDKEVTATEIFASPQKSLDSANDQDFQSARASLIQEEPELPQLEPGSPLRVGLELEDINDDDDDELDQLSVSTLKPEEKPEQEKEKGLAPEPKPEPKTEPKPEPKQESKQEPQREPLRKSESQDAGVKKPAPRPAIQKFTSLSSDTDNASKKSKSKLNFGKIFSRIFHNAKPNALKKRKRTETPTSSNSSSPIIAPPAKARQRNADFTDNRSSPLSVRNDDSSVIKIPLSPVKAPQQQEQEQEQKQEQKVHNHSKQGSIDSIDKFRQSSLTASLDEDILMDTDLVFDSLLLKSDPNNQGAWHKQRDLQLKLQTLASPDKKSSEPETSNSNSIKEETEEDDSNVDHELVQEFSKLGSYIEGAFNGVESNNDSEIIPQEKTETPMTPPTLHVNSPPRRSPRRPSLPNKNLAQSFYCHFDSNTRMVKRLQETWNNIHFDTAPPVMTTNGDSNEKSLRFANDVYVKHTWSPSEYFRSDKRFIRERRHMMRLENNGFVNSIKRELNEYKRNEMCVHIDSARFTHFFV